MSEKITAYIVGRVTLGEGLSNKDPEQLAKFLLKTFPQIKEIDIITGEWDLMVKFEVKTMEDYRAALGKSKETGFITIKTKDNNLVVLSLEQVLRQEDYLQHIYFYTNSSLIEKLKS